MRSPRWVAVVVITLAAGACGSSPVAPEPAPAENPPAPSIPAPTGPQPDFIVSRGMNVVPEGWQVSLSTVAFRRVNEPNAYVLGLQQSQSVSSMTLLEALNPTLVQVSGVNLVGRSPGVSAIRASYHGREYDLPLTVVRPNPGAASFAGTWTGVGARYCTDLRGNTRSCYPDYRTGKPVLSNQTLTLTLSASSGVLAGTIQIGNGLSPSIGPVNAGVTHDGRLAVGGYTESSHGSHTQLLDWTFTLSGPQLIGSGETESGFVNIYGPVLHRVTYPSITFTRQ